MLYSPIESIIESTSYLFLPFPLKKVIFVRAKLFCTLAFELKADLLDF